MEIETSWSRSLSWDSVIQTLMDVADLEVIGLGKIECLMVLPNEKVILVPPEVCSQRIGYIAVQLDESLEEATLLGFVKTVPACGELPLCQLSSLEDLPIHLKQPIHLSQWLMNVVDVGWLTIESLLNPQQQAELVFRFRGTEHTLHPQNSISIVQQGKLLDLGRDSKSQALALVVGLIPASREEINIGVKVYPTGNQDYLPEELELLLLDEAGIAVMQATARNTKSIQLNFSSEIGERFSVKIALGDVSFTEAFLT